MDVNSVMPPDNLDHNDLFPDIIMDFNDLAHSDDSGIAQTVQASSELPASPIFLQEW